VKDIVGNSSGLGGGQGGFEGNRSERLRREGEWGGEGGDPFRNVQRPSSNTTEGIGGKKRYFLKDTLV